MQIDNPILNTDGYKFSHFLQYPPETTAVSAYIETRGSSDLTDVVFFGLQAFLLSHMMRRVTRADVEEAEAVVTAQGQPFDKAGWMHIVERHNGILPLEIWALPEGTRVRRGVPMVQVVNTDPACFWLPGFIETALLRAIWYPSTVASHGRRVKQALRPYYEKTCDNAETVLRQAVHDFGARGVASFEQAGLGGAAHLIHFDRTDTMTGILFAQRYYAAELSNLSYPASEHSTMIAWGGDHEADAYRNMIDRFGSGTYSVVSDSFDINFAISEIWGKQLKDKVRAAGGRLIIRPDSGDPIENPTHAVRQLDYHFGSRQNGKGYKLLDDCVRVLQGDGISLSDIGLVLSRLEAFGFSAENVMFGLGGSLLQKLNRDTFSFAMKANARKDASGRWHELFKRPATMSLKASKAGRQAVVESFNGLEAVRLEDLGARQNRMRLVWRDGQLHAPVTFAEVRQRAS
ncbi:nicotinamide phosphoribosyltransferase [Rhizobium sp. RU20A]|uniref:nicotinate phosphoribosyltransferase n=1 Tax=Rhizobium sp. RU20A TaxID=1907412 RepID=UPI000955DE4E|nr:nicotinate phosphoribosyltransferase [Rhizobium sp. RU20A]SIQ74834.1 nicotinamide phosphoribosyltransferase [Rhizobium sp. RU20A]